MPLYLFQNQKTKEIREIFFHMSDDKTYKGENGNEENWARVYISVNAAIDTKVDHKNPNSFLETSYKKKGNYGNLVDLSKELSDKRAKESDSGADPVKTNTFDSWSETRNFKKHPQDTRSVKEIKKSVAAKKKIK